MTISGRVDERRPMVNLVVAPRNVGLPITCEAMVDTGFDGGVVVPEHLLLDMRFTPMNRTEITLADGETKMAPTYSGQATVGEITKPVRIIALPRRDGLVGMLFLDGLQLTVNAWPGGDVVIRRPGA